MDKIVCVGKNYLEHAKEMGDPIPDKPVIFIKPSSVLTTISNDGPQNNIIRLPIGLGEIHYETEIVIQVKKGGYKITEKDAFSCIGSIGVGLDLTLRGLQKKLKEAGHPWTIGKVFPNSAILGGMLPAESFKDYLSTPFELYLNGSLKQSGLGTQMIFSPQMCISYISEYFQLLDGDLIFTGTPAGVGVLPANAQVEVRFGPLRYSFETV
jgi:2-keto-4-pentenoate hydratase/2-oxohepta-3-ene-1,7-dioic acid hydratase in catechol pathway